MSQPPPFEDEALFEYYDFLMISRELPPLALAGTAWCGHVSGFGQTI